MSIELVMPSNHLILCHPLLLLPSIFPSIRVFSNESALRIGYLKYWSFSFNISPFNEHPGLISFRMDCLDLLSVQGNLTSLLQHRSSKASILRGSAFFFFFFFNLFFLNQLEANYFTIFQWFLSYIDMNQPWIYMYSPSRSPPPTSLSTRSLWVVPVHQVRALVSCIQPELLICFTLDNIHVSMLFS